MPVEYEELESALAGLRAGVDAAECHGMLVGHLLSTPWSESGFPEHLTVESWVLGVLDGAGEVFADASMEAEGDTEETPGDTERDLRTLETLWSDALSALGDDQMGFSPLLPADERAIGLRARAIGAWCAGFLSGLGEGGNLARVTLSSESQELIHDFTEISRIEPMPAGDEGAEGDLMQIVEYVRTGVQLIAHELGSQLGGPGFGGASADTVH